jgi:hypothetical protein
MSSHREAPQTSQDPVADSTDVYAFRSPDKPGTVTLIANYVPLQLPDGGPNFYEFGDDVTYDINIDNTGTGTPNITYRFNFQTTNTIPSSFLYNDGPITSLTGKGAALWNRRQTYTLTRLEYSDSGYVDQNTTPTSTTTLGTGLPCPPVNVGVLSTPNYATLAAQARHRFSKGGFTGEVFAGQRAEGFYVDLGAIFDLGILRPFQTDHARFGIMNTGLGKMAYAVNSTRRLNVHSLALQVPIGQLVHGGVATSNVKSADAVIGVWTSASRQSSRTYDAATHGPYSSTGALEQVSRLGNPLVNEAIIPIASKDSWNTYVPAGDSNFAQYFANPLLADLLPVLYPGVFPHLNEYNTKRGTFTTNGNGPDRADIAAIFLTGIPAGLIKNFQNLLATGNTKADMLRLNTAIPPAGKPNLYGLLGADLAGFPNGRRVFDDVTSIELRALAGATLPLVDAKFAKKGADAAAGLLTEGLTNSGHDLRANGTEVYINSFPYLGNPWAGDRVGNMPLVPA